MDKSKNIKTAKFNTNIKKTLNKTNVNLDLNSPKSGNVDEEFKKTTVLDNELVKVQVELKKSFEKYLRLFDCPSVGYITLDKNGKIQSCNNYACELLGNTKHNLIGTYFSRFITDTSNLDYFDTLKLSMSTLSARSCQINIQNSTKNIFNILLTIMPNPDNGEDNIDNMLVIQNITGQRQAELKLSDLKEEIDKIVESRINDLLKRIEYLEDLNKKLEESGRIKSQFLSNMSHELRTPMVGILGFSELIISESKNADIKEMASLIHSGGTRLLETLNLILDFTKVESEKISLVNERCDIKLLAEEIFKTYSYTVQKKSLEMGFVAEGKNFCAFIDPRIFKQVINNLLNNAVKYTNEGKVTLILLSDSKFITLKVKDTGIGIPENKIGLIFDEFRQASEGLNRHFGGAGLGLTLAKRFIELMGGKINVESIEGKGSEFTVIIPNAAESKDSGKMSDIKPIRALIVEDDEISYSLLKNIVEELCPADIATNLEDALNKIVTNKYDFVIMDINLGSEDTGIDVTREIRLIEGYKNIPVIAVTAYAMKGDKNMFLESGLDAYVSKPFTRSELLKTINNCLREKNH